MKKYLNYVECQFCKDWTDKTKYFHGTCKYCNNTKKVIDPKDLLCNLCGETMCPLGTHNEQIPHGLYNAEVRGGYESYHLFDLNTYIFSFCEKCLRELFNKCKVLPEVLNDYDSEWDFKEDQKYYEYKIWKDNGGHHQAYLDRKCNAVKDCQNKAAYTRLHNGEFTEESSCEEHKNLWAYGNATFTKFIPDVLKPFL